ncbi:Rieske 2Fe-2S domain-containing protein, partial [Rhizobium leguminosarum]|uniref:Rieske 2Fe-2S domain-containing protein n=1 Tax=Rhizobium leguminosarum TaxID=384 RepID=UPI003F97EE6A
FLTARIGTQPVIVGRDSRGDLQVLLNRCRHRGSIVCRLASGRAQQFVCPYHSWTYGNDGALVNMAQKDGYPPDLERERLGLY